MKVAANILHITESLTRLGGVETLVKQWIQGDEGSHAAALLDSPSGQITKGWGLRNHKLAGEFSVRNAARARFTHAKHLVFHNFAGMMMLSGVIPHERKCLFLHTNSSDVFALLPQRLPFLDSILVGGRDLKNEIHDRFPDLEIPVTAVSIPLDERYFEVSNHTPGPVLLLGYSGRLEHEQKQVLRLMEMCQALSNLGIKFQMEIAGSGSAESELRRLLPKEHCHFLGVLDSNALHEAYKRWDFLICTSDYETGPLVAMEAMATGTIPILPDIPCQATELIRATDVPLYRPGDMTDAIRHIQHLSVVPNLENLRNEVREKVADRRIEHFVVTINKVLDESASHPAIGHTPPLPEGFTSFLPFSLRKSSNAYLR